MTLDLSALDKDFGDEVSAAKLGVAPRAALDLFEEDTDNPRFEPNAEAFDALVADVRERGILQPIVVRRQADGKLRIRFGARRYRAAVHLGLLNAPYVVTEDERHFDDYAQVSENERRAPLQPLELATFVAKKLAQGEKKKAVAARLRMDPSALTHLLSIIGEAPPFLLELYHSQKCRTPQYLYELRRLGECQCDLVARRCAEAVDIDRRFIAALTSEVADASRAQRPAKPGTPSRREPIPKSGRTHAGPGDDGSKMGMEPPSAAPARSAPAGAGQAMGAGAWTRLLRPQLLGHVEGQDVLVEFSLQPSIPTSVVVQDRRGELREVPIAEVRLMHLSEVDSWADIPVGENEMRSN